MSADFSALLAQMRADFLAELPERCDRMEENVLALEQKKEGAFDELFRQVHSLKGSGGTFGLPVITTICHQFESFISEVAPHFNQQAANFALNYLDLLRRSGKLAAPSSEVATTLEQDLEQLRSASMPKRASVLLVEPSAAMSKLFQGALASLPLRLVKEDRGMSALEQLLHEPFDLLLASRELPDLNATALVAALRESDCHNKDIPVILISSNPAPISRHLGIRAMIRRDPQLVPNLARYTAEVLASSGRKPITS